MGHRQGKRVENHIGFTVFVGTERRPRRQVRLPTFYSFIRDSLSHESLIFMYFFRTLDSNNFRPLVSISAIAESESIHLNLVAVAATGTRFYLSCSSITNPSSRPHCLQLIHVRLPPGYAANAPVSRPRKVQMAHYRKGECSKGRLWCPCVSHRLYFLHRIASPDLWRRHGNSLVFEQRRLPVHKLPGGNPERIAIGQSSMGDG